MRVCTRCGAGPEHIKNIGPASDGNQRVTVKCRQCGTSQTRRMGKNVLSFCKSCGSYAVYIFRRTSPTVKLGKRVITQLEATQALVDEDP